MEAQRTGHYEFLLFSPEQSDIEFVNGTIVVYALPPDYLM